jgi:hypothetical protein
MEFEGMDTLMMLSSGFSIVLGVLLDVALLVVALTIVRRYRRDAAKWIVAPAIIGLVHGVLAPVVHAGSSFLVGDMYGVESMLGLHAATTFVSALLSAVTFGLLIVGIAKLARPPADAPA